MSEQTDPPIAGMGMLDLVDEVKRLRAALDKIANGRWNVGKNETLPLRRYAARVLRGESP